MLTSKNAYSQTILAKYKDKSMNVRRQQLKYIYQTKVDVYYSIIRS